MSGFNDSVRPRKLPQLVASQSASLGLFAAGLVFGWISCAGKNGANLRYDFPLDEDQFSWIGSVFDFGGAMMCMPSGVLANHVGRRRVMLIVLVPCIIGWVCVIWPCSATMLIVGRWILGGSAAPLFIVVPMYTSEIADKETRGKLGSYSALHYSGGILVAYTMGLLGNMHLQSLISACVPVVFFALVYWMPESPTYYLKRGNVDRAREVLTWLRGTDYDVESELEEKRAGMVEAERTKGSFLVALRVTSVRRSLVIGYGLSLIRCFGGTDGVFAYASSIFADDDSDEDDENLYAFVIGAVQLLAMFLVSFVIDRWGRRKLLLSSSAAMSLSALVTGTYFYLRDNGTMVDDLTWVPLVGISCYLVANSFGVAAIPWIIAEIFAPEVKATAMSTSNAGAWFVIFIILKFFGQATDLVGLCGIFWTFSAFLTLGFVFVYNLVPETKNKSLEQIQNEIRETSAHAGVTLGKISRRIRERVITIRRLGWNVFEKYNDETLKLEET